MANYINFATHSDARGHLTVVEKELPFAVKRFYYIHGVTDGTTVRAGHRHRKNNQVLVCVSGSCTVFCDNGTTTATFCLDAPNKGLYLPAEDWHTMQDFTADCVLLVLASEPYDVSDYIDTPYR